MRLRSKIFLVLAGLVWMLSFTPADDALHGIPLPVAVIFFGLFLITWVLPPKDFKQFDRDQALRKRLIRDTRTKRRQRDRAHSRTSWKAREVHP